MPKKKSNKTLGRKREYFDLTLPSGDTCQARRPGVQGFIKAGLLDSFDQLTAIVQTEHIDKKSTRPPSASGRVTAEQTAAAAAALTKDPSKLTSAFEVIDRLVVYIVTDPVVWISYQMKDETDKEFQERKVKAEEDEAVDIEDVDLEDRMFLINWAVGGSSDLEAFREKLEAGMAGVETGEGVSRTAE